MDKVTRRLSQGELSPLRHISHSMGGVAGALRQMSQASHVGKVVVSAQRLGGAQPALPPRSCPSLAITGGSGGLALMIASWLVQRFGPAHIRLLSRSGRAGDAAAAARLAITAACISTAAADAGSPADAATALAATSEGPALQAVLHAAGVLEDSLLDKQTAGSFR